MLKQEKEALQNERKLEKPDFGTLAAAFDAAAASAKDPAARRQAESGARHIRQVQSLTEGIKKPADEDKTSPDPAGK